MKPDKSTLYSTGKCTYIRFWNWIQERLPWMGWIARACHGIGPGMEWVDRGTAVRASLCVCSKYGYIICVGCVSIAD